MEQPALNEMSSSNHSAQDSGSYEEWRLKDYKGQRTGLRKQYFPKTTGLTHIISQGRHRFQPDRVPALGEGHEHELASLIKKLSSKDIYLQRKNQFCSGTFSSAKHPVAMYREASVVVFSGY